MTAIEIARRMAELGRGEDALRSYELALREGGLEPEEELEAAAYTLQFGDDYKRPYASFVDLYRRGECREAALAILTGAFYEPNVKELRGRYERNCRLLKKYPYLFRKDFPAFEDLPVRFYPYDDGKYFPFRPGREEFGKLAEIRREVIGRNFFRDLEKPILAEEVYSQYELEYLRDNVRRSDWVGRENHVYLHYPDWEEFCAWLQVWNLRPVLEEEKIVFLIGDEISRYPIDFKEEFGIDYSQYSVKPVGIREVTRMIWLTQLSAHNGVIFFTEVLDGHPNLIGGGIWMMNKAQGVVDNARETILSARSLAEVPKSGNEEIDRLRRELYLLKGVTDKDILVWSHLENKRWGAGLDPASRITPALAFSPHFEYINSRLRRRRRDNTIVCESPEYERIRKSEIFKHFKYIKTVTPFRRPTTSAAASLRYSWRENQKKRAEAEGPARPGEKRAKSLPPNCVTDSVLSRSYLMDPEDRLYRDSVLVRFEDGKLNPKATFTALAAFLDLPCTESMTYCSKYGERNPEGADKGDARGFDPRPVYETYPEYLGEPERYYIEYFLRDVYRKYGYDFQTYDGEGMDEAKMEELCGRFDVFDRYIAGAARWVGAVFADEEEEAGRLDGSKEAFAENYVERTMESLRGSRVKAGKALLEGLRFVSEEGRLLRMMPMLELDPALLERPLYH